jgi:trehalose 6-phosphate phosphatase
MHCPTTCYSEIDHLVEDGNQILLVTDFDGTLCPFVDFPPNVVVPRMIIESLGHLCSTPRIVIAVISGRALDDLTARLPLPVILAGNRGLAIRGPGFRFEHAGARLLRPKLTEICERLNRVIAPWKRAWIEDKALTATVHYRNVDRIDHYSLIRAVRQSLASYDGLFGVRKPRDAMEIHPRVAWNKGTCLNWIKRRLNMENSGGCICIGDDPADESMFDVNVGQVNIRVGSGGRSAACFHVADVFEVATLLAHLERAVRSQDHETSVSLTRSSS